VLFCLSALCTFGAPVSSDVVLVVMRPLSSPRPARR
jgi:hypothetical protein